jgi:hypothetical protein
MVPNTIAFRVRQLYDYQSVVNDYQYMQKAVYGLELISNYYKLREYSDEEKRINQVFNQLRKVDWIYKNNQLEKFEKFQAQIEKIVDKKLINDYKIKEAKLQKELSNLNRIENYKGNNSYSEEELEGKETEIGFNEKLNFLKADYLRIKNGIQNQTNWNQSIKNQLIEKINYRNILFLDLMHFKDCDFLTLNPKLERLTQKYMIDKVKIDRRWHYFKVIEHQNYSDEVSKDLVNALNFRFQNLLNYHTDNAFILRKDLLYVNFLDYFLGKIAQEQNEESSKYDLIIDNFSFLTQQKYFEKHFNIFFKKSNPFIPQIWFAASILTFSLGLILLFAKLFSMRNLFITTFSVLISFFLIAFLLNSEYQVIKDAREVIISILGFSFERTHLQNGDYQLFLSVWIIPFLLMSISAILAAFLNFKLINFKWIPTVWVLLVSSGAFISFIACGVLFSRKGNSIDVNMDNYHHSFEYLFSQQIFLIYPLLILSMFLMYAFYNHLTLIPKRK